MSTNATAAFTLPVNLFLSLHFTLSLYHGAETSAEFSGVLSVPKGSAQRDPAFSRGKQHKGGELLLASSTTRIRRKLALQIRLYR